MKASQPICLVRYLTVDKMKKAVQMISAGAVLIATNGDTTIPHGNTIVPHTGAIVAGIEAAAGKTAKVMGKPDMYMLDNALKRLGSSKEACCILGDNLETDIMMGYENDIMTYLVLTGVTDQEQLNDSKVKPTHVFKHLHELMCFEQNHS